MSNYSEISAIIRQAITQANTISDNLLRVKVATRLMTAVQLLQSAVEPVGTPATPATPAPKPTGCKGCGQRKGTIN